MAGNENQNNQTTPSSQEEHGFFKQPYVWIVFVLAVVAILWLVVGGGAGIISEKAKVLKQPKAGEEENYQMLVEKLAVESGVLTIGARCEMDPLVLKLKAGEDLVIKNADSDLHTVSFEDESFFQVSPGRERTLNIAEVFGKSAGTYRYRCGDLSKERNVGVMYITE